MNEYHLYHGAEHGLIDRLVMQGLDPRYGGERTGKLFGVGTYFASNSSKADIYTTPTSTGERCQLVVRVCLGEAHKAKAGGADAAGGEDKGASSGAAPKAAGKAPKAAGKAPAGKRPLVQQTLGMGSGGKKPKA